MRTVEGKGASGDEMNIGMRRLAGALAGAALGLCGSALARGYGDAGGEAASPMPLPPDVSQGGLSATGLASTDRSQRPPFQSGALIVDSPNGPGGQGGIVTTPGETGVGGSGNAGAGKECTPAPRGPPQPRMGLRGRASAKTPTSGGAPAQR